MEEYERCQEDLRQLDNRRWLSTEMQLLNRPVAPRLLLSYKLAGRNGREPRQARTAFIEKQPGHSEPS